MNIATTENTSAIVPQRCHAALKCWRIRSGYNPSRLSCNPCASRTPAAALAAEHSSELQARLVSCGLACGKSVQRVTVGTGGNPTSKPGAPRTKGHQKAGPRVSAGDRLQ